VNDDQDCGVEAARRLAGDLVVRDQACAWQCGGGHRLYAVEQIYQPQYQGERADIDRAECVVSQLKFKPGTPQAKAVGATKKKKA
jgi:hypothetical protein